MAEEGEPAPAPVEETKEEEPQPEPEPEPAAEEPKEEKPAASSSCSGEDPCAMIRKPFEESEFFGEMKKIFMWEDLMVSLAVFCAINVFFLVLICYEFTVLGLFCWICLFALLAGLCIDIMRVIAYFKGEEAKSNLADKNFEVPAKYIDGFFDLVKSLIKVFIAICVNAILVRSVVFSLGMIGGFLFLIYLSSHLGMCGMIYGFILFSFIWFRLYNDKQQMIDDLWAKIKAKVNEQIQQLKEKMNKPKAQ